MRNIYFFPCSLPPFSLFPHMLSLLLLKVFFRDTGPQSWLGSLVVLLSLLCSVSHHLTWTDSRVWTFTLTRIQRSCFSQRKGTCRVRMLRGSWWIFRLFFPCNYYWQQEKAVEFTDNITGNITGNRNRLPLSQLGEGSQQRQCWTLGWDGLCVGSAALYISIYQSIYLYVHMQCMCSAQLTVLLNLDQINNITRLFKTATRWRA